MMTAIFWIFFALFRGLSILQARFQSPKIMMWVSLIGSVTSSTALIFVNDTKAAFAVSGSFGAAMKRF